MQLVNVWETLHVRSLTSAWIDKCVLYEYSGVKVNSTNSIEVVQFKLQEFVSLDVFRVGHVLFVAGE